MNFVLSEHKSKKKNYFNRMNWRIAKISKKIENFMAKFDELKDLPVNIVSLLNREHVQMDIVQYLELDLQLYLAPIVFIVIIIV